MDRRNFLRTLIGGVAAGAAVRTWPFRVYSFPSILAAGDVFEFIGHPDTVALQLEKMRDILPELWANDKVLDAFAVSTHRLYCQLYPGQSQTFPPGMGDIPILVDLRLPGQTPCLYRPRLARWQPFFEPE